MIYVCFPVHCYSLTTICSFLFAVLFYIGIRKYAPDEDYELSDNMWKLLILLMATPFSIVFSIVILFHKRELGNNWTNSYEYAVILLIAFLSFISLFWCVLVLAKQQKLERQSMLMEMNSKYYEFLEEQHFEIRRFRLSDSVAFSACFIQYSSWTYIRRFSIILS